ncbi:hypothetical protein CCP3SC15_4460001 [Gammaproteobacteria bacterium]
MLDIYATSVDYTPNAEQSQRFFAAVQNKMHYKKRASRYQDARSFRNRIRNKG